MNIYRLLLLSVTPLALAACIAGRAGGEAAGAPSQAPRGLDTLFVTWSEDPTSTMTIQWLERGETLPLADAQSADATVAIPTLSDIAIDGDASDWRDRGYAVRLLADAAGNARDPKDHAVTLRLANAERGLLVLLDVTDDEARESTRDDQLWNSDSVDLFLARADGANPWELIVAPGIDPEHPTLRTQVVDRRKDKDTLPALAPEVAAAKTDTGYRVEALLPWDATGIDPASLAAGEPAARFQLYSADHDREGSRTRLVWFSAEDTAGDTRSSRVLTLGGPAAAPGRQPIAERARGQLLRNEDGRTASIIADPALVGQEIALVAGGKTVGKATLRDEKHAARAEIAVPDPAPNARWGTLTLEIDGQPVGQLADRPDAWAIAPNTARIHYGLAAQGGDADRRDTVVTSVHRFGDSAYTVQRARLTGLEPDTDYAFQVEGSDETFRFRTAPKTLEPGKPIVFAEGGDLGSGGVVPQLHQVASSWDPLFGLIGGDLAYSDGRNVETEMRFFREWHAYMRTADNRLIPLIPAIGNHEVNGGWGQTRDKAPFFFALFGDLFPAQPYGTLDFGDYLSLVFLDTGHVTPLEGPQTEWLATALEERLGTAEAPKANPPHVFPAYHIPGYPSSRSFLGAQSKLVRAHWVPLFEKHGLRVVFEHHDHTYKRTHPLLGDKPTEDPRGIVYLGDGCWGRTPREVHPEREYLAKALSQYHMFKVTLEPTSATFEAIDEKGVKFDEHRYDR